MLACLHSTENTPLKILPDISKMSQEMEVEIYHDNISWILKRVRFLEQDTLSENLKVICCSVCTMYLIHIHIQLSHPCLVEA